MTGYRKVIAMGSHSPRRLRRKWDDLRRQLEQLDGHAARLAHVRIRAIERLLISRRNTQPTAPLRPALSITGKPRRASGRVSARTACHMHDTASPIGIAHKAMASPAPAGCSPA